MGVRNANIKETAVCIKLISCGLSCATVPDGQCYYSVQGWFDWGWGWYKMRTGDRKAVRWIYYKVYTFRINNTFYEYEDEKKWMKRGIKTEGEREKNIFLSKEKKEIDSLKPIKEENE